MQGLEDHHLATGLGQIRGASDAGGTGADDGNPAAVGLNVRLSGPALGDGHVADETFQTPDRYRFQVLAYHAHLFALRFLGTDPAANGGQQVRLREHIVRTVEVLVTDLLDEAGNVDCYRATLHTGFLGTHDASLGLVERLRHRVTACNLCKVAHPLLWGQ